MTREQVIKLKPEYKIGDILHQEGYYKGTYKLINISYLWELKTWCLCYHWRNVKTNKMFYTFDVIPNESKEYARTHM